MYKLHTVKMFDALPTTTVAILRLTDNAFIPFDPANTDYQAYLKWLEAGNAPLPPEESLNGN